jgi:hypothetical protein
MIDVLHIGRTRPGCMESVEAALAVANDKDRAYREQLEELYSSIGSLCSRFCSPVNSLGFDYEP